MNQILQQLRQWPPTATTVIGVGLVAGAAIYHVTGSLEWALFAAGVFKAICPQASPAVDEATDLLGKMPH